MNYNSCLNFGLDHRGLYIAGSAFFRLLNPPVRIPWSGIRAESRKVLFTTLWTLTVADAEVKIQIADSLYREIKPFLGPRTKD